MGKCWTIPGRLRPRKSRSLACSSTFCSRVFTPSCMGIFSIKSALTITRHVVITKKVGTTSISLDGWDIRCRSRWIFYAAIRFWRRHRRMHAIHRHCEGFRFTSIFGVLPLRTIFALGDCARAIDGHDLALQAQPLANAKVIGGAGNKADTSFRHCFAKGAKHRAVDNRLRCRQRSV